MTASANSEFLHVNHLVLTAASDGEIRIQSRPLPSHAPAPLALAGGAR